MTEEIIIYQTPTQIYEKNTSHCLHCHKKINIKNSLFCCYGCQAVYTFIISNKMDSYYEILNQLGESASNQNDPNKNSPVLFTEIEFRHLFKTTQGDFGFFIPNIKCAACIWIIERILQNIPDIENINVNILSKIVSFSLIQENKLPEVARHLLQTGYIPHPLPYASSRDFRQKQERERLKDIAISGFAAGNIMLLALSNYFGDYLGIDASIKKVFILLSMIIAIPATLYSGRSFFKNAFKALFHKKIHIDITISFAIIASLCSSIYDTLKGTNHVYFDSITSLIFLLLIGRYFHERSLTQAKELGELTQSLIPPESYLIQPGDFIEIPIGSIIPADGKIIKGTTEINEASLTGEEMPVLKKEGDQVFGGSQNILKPITIIAEHSGHNTWISSLEKIIKNARDTKTSMQQNLDKILPFFTISTISISIIAAIIWLFIDSTKSLNVFVSVLIISCPCALALATPLALSQALKSFWEHGFIVKSANAIENLAQVNMVVLDKTGTITESKLSVESVNFLTDLSEAEKIIFLSKIAFVAKKSIHHISRALADHFFNPQLSFDILDLDEIPGQGIRAYINNYSQAILIGNPHFVGLSFEQEENDQYIVYAREANIQCAIVLKESLREGIESFIAFLKKEQKNVYMLSGDRKASALRVAQQIGIPPENVYAQCSPKDKVDFINTQEKNGYKILAIGDGVNDAAMLAKSSVSIASHGGVDVALDAADIFLKTKKLSLLKNAFLLSKYTNKSIKILLTISLIYNFFALILSCLGIVGPLFAAVFMPFSTFTVYLIVKIRRGSFLWEL